MLHKCEVLLLLIELSSQEFLLVMPSSELSYWAGQRPSLSLSPPYGQSVAFGFPGDEEGGYHGCWVGGVIFLCVFHVPGQELFCRAFQRSRPVHLASAPSMVPTTS